MLNLILPASTNTDTLWALEKLPDLEILTFEPVGRAYEAYHKRAHHNHSLSLSSQSDSSEDESEDSDVGDEGESDHFLTVDPKNWKDQDHYALLGLEKLRYKATADQIKKAYKKKVLLHHPDKRKARGLPVKPGQEDYFTCATRAYEILGVPTKRQAYDSIDPLFDDSVPSNSVESKKNFFKVFGPAFERNSRWSAKTKNMPQLGDENTSFKEVDRFYDFWYSFESWREYSYLDEEEAEKGENRDERRWIEKQNKAIRLKRKKEEMQRIRQLVDNAYACDPRIIKFKTEELEKKAAEKEKRIAEKKAKQDAHRQKIEEEERIKQEALEAERIAKEKEEEEVRAQQAAKKREREQQKKNLKVQRKKLRTVVKDWDFLATSEAEKIQNMQDLEKLAEQLSIECLTQLNDAAASGDKDAFSKEFKFKINELNEKLSEEKRLHIESLTKKFHQGSAEKAKVADDWSDQEIQILIRAVNLFPAGTNARWETIANFLKLHVPGCEKNAKEALAKAKDIQKNDANLKEDANKKAFENFVKDTQGTTVTVAEASERYETPAEVQAYDLGSNPAPWTADEQKLLEQAMKTYPATLSDRWDKIAEAVPTRTKKDCMKRYKELVELIRTKKLAQAAVAKKK